MKTVSFGLFFKEDRLCENLTAEANIRLVQKGKKGKSQEFLQQVEEGLLAVGLKDCGKRQVKELSGGMKRRVATSRAYICRLGRAAFR